MKNRYDVLSKLSALEGFFASKLAILIGYWIGVLQKSVSGAISHTKISSNQLLILNRMVKTSNERSARRIKNRLGLRASSRTVQKNFLINFRLCSL
jgi:hypothetical protein